MFKNENGERMKILQIQRLIRKAGSHIMKSANRILDDNKKLLKSQK